MSADILGRELMSTIRNGELYWDWLQQLDEEARQAERDRADEAEEESEE